MKILVIGGTQFVGKHFVREAVARGHEVTLFNRGSKPAPDGVAEVLIGDRNKDLGKLGDGSWDAVVDNVAYFPRQVKELAQALSGRVGSYLLVSTISVYADQTTAHQTEDAPLIELDDPTTEEITGETYGGLKVLCERALEDHFSGDKLIVRPGLIVGPDDPTDRFTYWPARIARGGRVLAPEGPDMPVQWIDVRDLARWMVDALEQGTMGTIHAVSQADRFTMGDVVNASLQASESDAQVTWVDGDFLLDQGVGPFVELPLWIPGENINFSRFDASKALAAGLEPRPVEDTVSATLQWHRQAPDRALRAGLSPEREAELLAAWEERQGRG